MIKDVKEYLSTVGNRLSKAFSVEGFGTEKELEFWSLSAEHMSRKEPPSFPDIAKWIDMLYRAPVHIVYRKEGDNLVLSRRHLFVENLLKKEGGTSDKKDFSVEEKQFIQDFENQMGNLEKKRAWDEDFSAHGISSHTIGNCEHIPIYDTDGENWGVYVVGPFIKSPDLMVPKLSIVGRILAIWLVRLNEEEEMARNKYQESIDEVASNLGTGALNTEGITHLILSYLTNKVNAKSGLVVELIEEKPKIISSLNISGKEAKEVIKEITDSKRELYIPFKAENSNGFIWIDVDSTNPDVGIESLKKPLSDTVGDLISYREDNLVFSNQLLETYYKMLRAIEKSRDKTQYHTPRLIAFVERFGIFFGLEEIEIDRIKLTAKLHDIGYVGATSISSSFSIDSEMSHPITGAKMVNQLPIHKDVIKGIETHHEWVNGQGTPYGLEGDKIPWSGKIISVFEFIVDFIETYEHSDAGKEEELIQLLNNNLIERADKQFDMVLIPTVIQLIQMLGWEGCKSLGVNE